MTTSPTTILEATAALLADLQRPGEYCIECGYTPHHHEGCKVETLLMLLKAGEPTLDARQAVEAMVTAVLADDQAAEFAVAHGHSPETEQVLRASAAIIAGFMEAIARQANRQQRGQGAVLTGSDVWAQQMRHVSGAREARGDT